MTFFFCSPEDADREKAQCIDALILEDYPTAIEIADTAENILDVAFTKVITIDGISSIRNKTNLGPRTSK